MSAIRFFTDEDVHGSIAVRPREAGFDAGATPEVDRLGSPDESQLEWSTLQGRILLTFNVADSARLHNAWVTQGRRHAGIIVSPQRPVGVVLRRLLHLAEMLSADDMTDRLEYSSNW
jgi:Domain of unknown function (DUF5615)